MWGIDTEHGKRPFSVNLSLMILSKENITRLNLLS